MRELGAWSCMYSHSCLWLARRAYRSNVIFVSEDEVSPSRKAKVSDVGNGGAPAAKAQTVSIHHLIKDGVPSTQARVRMIK